MLVIFSNSTFLFCYLKKLIIPRKTTEKESEESWDGNMYKIEKEAACDNEAGMVKNADGKGGSKEANRLWCKEWRH